MSYLIKPIANEIAAPTGSGTATDVSNAQYVRIVNTAATTAHLVTFAGSFSGTMTIAGGDTVLIQKSKEDTIFAANAAVKLAKVSI